MAESARTELRRGSITASCGHKLRDDEVGVGVYYKESDCTAGEGFFDCVAYACFCEACEKEWRERGDLFANQAEADAWLDSVRDPT